MIYLLFEEGLDLRSFIITKNKVYVEKGLNTWENFGLGEILVWIYSFVKFKPIFCLPEIILIHVPGIS